MIEHGGSRKPQQLPRARLAKDADFGKAHLERRGGSFSPPAVERTRVLRQLIDDEMQI
jgi:hypothetical protein